MTKTFCKKTILLFFFSIILVSCVSKKRITYFQYDEINQEKVNNSYVTTFKPDDLLEITISSQDINALKPFMKVVAVNSISTSNISSQNSYLIDSKGEIDFPVLGKIKLGGLSREEAIILLKTKLSPAYIKNPSVNIKILNFKITVTGDVRKPGTYTIPNERVSIIDAIGLAGDLNISAKRDNILVIREEKGKKILYNVNYLSKNIFTSPVFYLQQNDVIYVEHNVAKIQSASYNQNTGLFISIGSVLISLISILSR